LSFLMTVGEKKDGKKGRPKEKRVPINGEERVDETLWTGEKKNTARSLEGKEILTKPIFMMSKKKSRSFWGKSQGTQTRERKNRKKGGGEEREPKSNPRIKRGS